MRAAFVVWGLWAAVAAATFATNARTPTSHLYAVDEGGVAGAAGRVVVLLGWPIALAAVAIVLLAADRLLASTAGRLERTAVIATATASLVLCATIVLPGVVDPKDVDLRPMNVPAAAGTALALGLSIRALAVTGAGPRRTWTHAERRGLVAFSLLGIAALPWVLANVGIYAGDIPGLGHVFMSKEPTPEPGYPELRAVHLGNHDGFDGLLLALSAFVLLRAVDRARRVQRALVGYLSLILVYGLGVAAADWSLEQVKKRGWAAHGLPSVSRPSFSPAWALLLLTAGILWLLLSRGRVPVRARTRARPLVREPPPPRRPRGRGRRRRARAARRAG